MTTATPPHPLRRLRGDRGRHGAAEVHLRCSALPERDRRDRVGHRSYLEASEKLNCTPLGMSTIGRKSGTAPRPPRKPAWHTRPLALTAWSESRRTLFPTRSSTRSTPPGASS